MHAQINVRRDAPPHARWLWGLVGVAWALAVLATLTGQRALIDHHFLLEESGLPWPVATAFFLVGWQVMVAAMMAPSSMPVFAYPARQGVSDKWKLQRAHALALAGFAGAWTVFGLLAFTGDTLIHHLVDAWPWLAAHNFLIGATTLAIAGAFQVTPWKSACLTCCRQPHLEGETDDPNVLSLGWRRGLRHGADSIGCCWALMLIMFGLGVGDLFWMAGLTGVMLGESRMTNVRSSRRMRLVIGVGLLALSGLWLAHPAWLVPIAAS